MISTSPPLAVRGNIEGLRYFRYYLWFSIQEFKDTPHDCSELSKYAHKTKLILRKGPVLAPYGPPNPWGRPTKVRFWKNWRKCLSLLGFSCRKQQNCELNLESDERR